MPAIHCIIIRTYQHNIPPLDLFNSHSDISILSNMSHLDHMSYTTALVAENKCIPSLNTIKVKVTIRASILGQRECLFTIGWYVGVC